MTAPHAAARASCTCGATLTVTCNSPRVVDDLIGRFGQVHDDHEVTVTRPVPAVGRATSS